MAQDMHNKNHKIHTIYYYMKWYYIGNGQFQNGYNYRIDCDGLTS